MARILTLTLALCAGSALATGERVSVTPGSPLAETVCFSMECTQSRPEAVVTTKVVKTGLEITVTGLNGERKASFVAPMRADGTLSSTELVRATAMVLKAIEDPAPAPSAPTQRVAAAKKAPRARLIARR